MEGLNSPPKPRRFVMMPEQLTRQQLSADGLVMQQSISSPAGVTSSVTPSQYTHFDTRGLADSRVQNKSEKPFVPQPALPSSYSPALQTSLTSSRNQKISGAGEATDIANFENQMVDKAMNNLPSVISEVFNMQKGQANDIQEMQQAVQENKDRIAEVEEKRDELLQEISSLTKRIYMTEDSIKESGKACKQLNSDIKNLVVRLYESQRDVRLEEEGIAKETRKLNEVKEKKAKFAEEVDEYELRTSEMQKQMDKISERLTVLRTQKSVMEKDQTETKKVVNGMVAKEIQSDIDNLKQRIKDADSECKKKQEKIADEKEKQNQINQTIQVLQKRNSAQLTRLRRQLKDVQAKNKQWRNQITNLEMKIQQLRNEVDTD